MNLTLAVTGQVLIHQPLDLTGAAAGDLLDFLKADVTIGNFEGVVQAPGAWPTKTKTVHAVDKEVIASLAGLHFTAMSHANNHAFDLGPPGISASHAAMKAHKIQLAGSGMDLSAACSAAPITIGAQTVALLSVDLGPQPEIVYAGQDRAGIAPLRLRRKILLPPDDYARLSALNEALGDAARLRARQKVGYSGEVVEGLEAFGTVFLPGDRLQPRWDVDPTDRERLQAEILGAKGRGEIVVLALHSHHWDADWTVTPVWYDRLTKDLVDAGADVVIGTGAPVLQPMRIYRDRAILPGLGNFIFHTRRAAVYDREGVDVWTSAAVRLHLDPEGRCLQVNAMPIRASRASATGKTKPPFAAAPALLTGEEAQTVLQRLECPERR
ncbi:CapA family protein [Rhizobium sp. SSA_523]|uniref:CapA family protein n=1 Tax=Rhizobium sp. SSA_523 TaxID=2952477 RepID=UPI002090042C|nr:CapA family protein [Rhizobium sp. SSA_523]MCO5732489.1 CapA family protein [Rhizobium sp. SSA_523]WKC22370.1 CapA family protein [Rhizobium sp. SSA_523]